MGRSFSVYLFCLAMDPLFVYLNRIPGVITVQGYVDDTTIIGNAQDPDWLASVADCYQDLATAGFVMDQHSCFRGCITTHNKFPPRCCSVAFSSAQWPSLRDSVLHATISGVLHEIFVGLVTILLCLEKVYFPMKKILLMLTSKDLLSFVLSAINRHRTFSVASHCICWVLSPKENATV